ncbi:MAG: hypothetical protein A3I61_03770 [Acidobacteria bacterium RIFCSPLOWO2_02_FULL_68_18]|nr:MAG: hypothetical protein A3I61_03770 [Acidobacteria bacterium RIFCSPLOWO2_02_FULL_68_18]OFW52161.1 MAG: hypothetical protein A3G77_08075 [Acidobacteria bacterium RIFCSPLOWO2_12_FULL_68_19]
MPVELGVWRIDGQLSRVQAGPLDLESRLEDILDSEIAIANPDWMIIGRQVITPHGGRVDLLAIDRDGNLVIVELKRNHMPRDIVTQVLDYGSWVGTLRAEDIAPIFNAYRKTRFPNEPTLSIDAAFCRRFGLKSMPEELNERHELVIVGSEFDADTERIVTYLSDTHGVNINAVFFRVFKDGDREYLTRAWLREPESSGSSPGASTSLRSASSPKGDWNGEYYVSFGDLDDSGRSWEDAVKYGFISGGGGEFYVRTLSLLSPGDRVWVNVPGEGYVGVGEVTKPVVRIDQFLVPGPGGRDVPITEVPLKGPRIVESLKTAEVPEHLVGVRWLASVPRNKAIKEKGLFGNQNTVARPRDPKWAYTIERLRERFGIVDGRLGQQD